MDFDFDSDASVNSFFSRLHSSDSSPRNLNQIFEDDLRPMQQESRNLRYQPGGTNRAAQRQQAQPSSSSSSSTSVASSSSRNGTLQKSSRWVVTFAKVVQVYQGNAPLERMGLALSVLGDYEAVNLIVYKRKTQVIGLKLKPSGGTIHMREHYVQFYDDNRHYWSLRFVEESDEQAFIDILMDHNLPIELHNSSRSQREERLSTDHMDSSGDDTTTPSTHYMEPRNHRDAVQEHNDLQLDAPQPLPRSRSLATQDQQRDEDYIQRLSSRFRHMQRDRPDRQPEREEIPEEDVIVTPMPRPIGTSSSKSSSTTIADRGGSESKTAAFLLNQYLENREGSVQKSIEKNLENIVGVLKRLSNLQVGEEPKETTTKATMTTAATGEDPEDKLLELEQALLNAKKENRALLKDLRKREQDLVEFQKSSVALLEEVLIENNELKMRCAMPMLESSGGVGNNGNDDNEQGQSSSCTYCERSAQKINILKRHITALEVALRKHEDPENPDL